MNTSHKSSRAALVVGALLTSLGMILTFIPYSADANVPPNSNYRNYLWHSNDTGIDPPIVFRCLENSTSHLLPEGDKTPCAAHYIYNRPGQAIWCLRYTEDADYGGIYKHWIKWAGQTGWYLNPNGRWDYGGCTVRVR